MVEACEGSKYIRKGLDTLREKEGMHIWRQKEKTSKPIGSPGSGLNLI